MPFWIVQPSGSDALFRAVSAVDGNVCWVSGSKSAVVRTVDGGKTWQKRGVPGETDQELRSIVAFDADHAVVLAIGEGEKSRVYRTDDGGQHWNETYRSRDSRVFLDAMAFADREHGYAFGDPVDGKFTFLSTADGGRTWTSLPGPEAKQGEAAFAASGQCLSVRGQKVWIATGGNATRVLRSSDGGKTWNAAETGIPIGNESAGLFGVQFWSDRDGLVVGGDYQFDERWGYAATTRDGGSTWNFLRPPLGLREAVVSVGKRILMIGPAGTDYSDDRGKSWHFFGNPGRFHTAATAGRVVWAAGENGLIARLSG